MKTLKETIEDSNVESSQLLPDFEDEQDQDDFATKLAINYFDQDLLDESQSNIGWLM